MTRGLPAVLALLIALSAAAAKPEAKLSRTAGKIFQVSGQRVTLFDKAGHTEEFKATPRTKVTLDGKPASFSAAATPGTLVLNALYNPNTKTLAKLELKSAPAARPDADDPAAPGKISGEVANTDIFKNMLSVRSPGKPGRDFTITDATKIVREVKGNPDAPIQFEAVQVGDPVEIFSRDGRTASEVRVRSR